MTRAEYDAVEAVNWSTLKHMADSPLHYHHALTRPQPDNPRFSFGRAVHCAILEPARFATDYVVWEGERRAGKIWEAFQDGHRGAEILRSSEYADVVAVRDAVLAHPAARKLIDGSAREQGLVWTDPATGILCKGRLDLLGPRVVDLKTAADVTPRGFARAAATYQYHCQLAWYAQGASESGHPLEALPAIIAVETAAPHDVVVYEIDDDALYLAEQTIRDLLQRLAGCRDSGKWPGRSQRIETLSLPPWAYGPEGEEETGLDLVVNGRKTEV